MPPIFNVNSASFENVNISGSILLTGSFVIDGKFNVEELLNYQIDVITESKTFYTPSWTKSLTVIAIGGGGSGGGGVAAREEHHIAVGGAGGSGGNISYTKFELTGSVQLECFIGKEAQGGNTGSSEVTASILSDFSSSTMISDLPQNITENIELSKFVLGYSGENGLPTIVYVFGENSLYVGDIYASGGVGGSGGFSFEVTSSITGSKLDGFITSSLPQIFSYSGGTNSSDTKTKGENILYGGQGGYGISLPLRKDGKDKYSNSAPSLPWGIRTTSGTDPYRYEDGGVLKIPFGLHPDKLTLNYNIPSDIAPTGGGGGNGWVTSSLEYTSSISIGTGGSLNNSKKLFDYQIATGGAGGNISTKNSLSISTPTTGSDSGAGGGGGASDLYGGSAQVGANGKSGVVVVISKGS